MRVIKVYDLSVAWSTFVANRCTPPFQTRVETDGMVVALALWWGQQLGQRAIRHRERRRFDRADRRDLSPMRLGRTWLLARFDHGWAFLSLA